MTELRDLNSNCICDSAGTYHCRRCKTKHYCSKTCQRRDWPLHRLQCTNEQMISTVMSARTSHSEFDYVEMMGTPAWVRFLDIVYDALRKRVGPFAEPQEHAVFWIGIAAEEVKQITAVAFVFVAQEPQRLFMFVDAPAKFTAAESPTVLLASEEDMRVKRILDPKCIVYDLDTSRKPMNLAYPINVIRPFRIETIVDWQLRGRT